VKITAGVSTELPDNEGQGINEAASYLGVSSATMLRWHTYGWAPCTHYEDVSVPQVGIVSARRWTGGFLKALKDRLPELEQKERERKAALKTARMFGKQLAAQRLPGLKAPRQLIVDPIPPDFRELTEVNGNVFGLNEVVKAMLREQHSWGCSVLFHSVGLSKDFESKCELQVSWYQPTTYESLRDYTISHRSHGGLKGERPFYRVTASMKVDGKARPDELLDRFTSREEYAFIATDREIGSLKKVSAADNLLLVQLHELAHAADKWMKRTGIELPAKLLEKERGLRPGVPESGEGEYKGHGIRWSTLYRILRIAAGLVRKNKKAASRGYSGEGKQ